eukprot:TRINITY_DN7664_c0_g2_i2.p1 TRINITY_DN7664_c0_g2~~TRINITY_DN7664_c0_g2_i2.p1  ORF type:complete len:702 (-),score=174.72 TRINITY_DN7664_c0_g2_i2:239-2185(-)
MLRSLVGSEMCIRDRSVSGKTSYLIAGVDEHGEVMKGSKYKKADSLTSCGIIDEDGLFKLIQPDYDPDAAINDDADMMLDEPEPEAQTTVQQPDNTTNAQAAPGVQGEIDHRLWTDKYRPKKVSDLIGNQESVRKLQSWLQQWKEELRKQRAKLAGAGDKKKKPTGKGKDMKKAALLSGPPGIGKTSAATLVAMELGYEVLEFNASSVRSKKALQEQVLPKVSNHSIGEYYTGESETARELVIIMDECDGMGGGDRGGMAALIELIKGTQYPIICICNDRQHQKVRSLATYCADFQFQRPTSRHMLGAMMKIAYKEGLKVSKDQIVAAAESSGCDVRQVINVLQMAQTSSKGMSDYNNESSKKDRKCMLGPFDVIWPLFSADDVKASRIDERIDYFFVDYSMVPMIVQENYLAYQPATAKNVVDDLEAASRAADAMAEADTVMPHIRGANQNWGLLPFYGVQSTVAPAYHRRCAVGGGPRTQGWIPNSIKFPGILGKMSNANKRNRILGTLQAHTRMCASTPRAGMRLDYLPSLRNMLVKPMLDNGKDGIVEAMEAMELYGMDREDYDTLGEFVFKEYPNPMDNVPTVVKTAFTKAWNQRQKEFVQVAKGKKGKKGAKSTPVKAETVVKEEESEDDFIDDEVDLEMMM